MRILKLIILSSGILVAGMILTVVYAGYKAISARKDAERLLSDLRGLRVGESSLEEVGRIANAHHRYLVASTSKCDGDTCYFDFLYYNSPLSRLGISSRVAFGVRVQVFRRQVDVIILDMHCGTRPQFFGVYVMEATQGSSPDQGPFVISNVRREVTWVRLTREASQAQRDKAFSLSLGCFTHVGRCRTKGELLPAMAREVEGY